MKSILIRLSNIFLLCKHTASRSVLSLIIVYVTGLILVACPNGSKGQVAPTLQSLNRSFQVAYDAKRYLEASALGLYAISRGERQPEALYNTACALALSGDRERAFAILNRAIAAGYAETSSLQADHDLESLHADVRWAKTVANAVKREAQRSRALASPERAAFITTDISRFWIAYDRAIGMPHDRRLEIFQREYLDRATPGMKDWIRVRNVEVTSLVRFIDTHPRFFVAIRPFTLHLESQHGPTQVAFRNLKNLYPEALFPGTTFCLGAFYGGGTVSQGSLLMSAEMYTLTSETPKEELSRWQKSVLTPLSDLPCIIAHELIHFQQRYPSGDETLLRACIQEGSADFLGELCSASVGQFHQQEVFPYGNAHERELWDRFQKDMDRTDRQTVWLYSESGEGKRPDDLGYYMGYKICESYYRNASDKRQAIHDILNIGDFKTFLKASHYAEKFQ